MSLCWFGGEGGDWAFFLLEGRVLAWGSDDKGGLVDCWDRLGVACLGTVPREGMPLLFLVIGGDVFSLILAIIRVALLIAGIVWG